MPRMDYCCNKWVPATYPSTCRRNWALPSRGYKAIQREKGACSCLLPFSVANENDHPRDTCSRGRNHLGNVNRHFAPWWNGALRVWHLHPALEFLTVAFVSLADYSNISLDIFSPGIFLVRMNWMKILHLWYFSWQSFGKFYSTLMVPGNDFPACIFLPHSSVTWDHVYLIITKRRTLKDIRSGFVGETGSFDSHAGKRGLKVSALQFAVRIGKQHYRDLSVMPIVLKILWVEERYRVGELDRRLHRVSTRRVYWWERSELSLNRLDVSSYPPISPHRSSLIAKLKAISTANWNSTRYIVRVETFQSSGDYARFMDASFAPSIFLRRREICAIAFWVERGEKKMWNQL